MRKTVPCAGPNGWLEPRVPMLTTRKTTRKSTTYDRLCEVINVAVIGTRYTDVYGVRLMWGNREQYRAAWPRQDLVGKFLRKRWLLPGRYDRWTGFEGWGRLGFEWASHSSRGISELSDSITSPLKPSLLRSPLREEVQTSTPKVGSWLSRHRAVQSTGAMKLCCPDGENSSGGRGDGMQGILGDIGTLQQF